MAFIHLYSSFTVVALTPRPSQLGILGTARAPRNCYLPCQVRCSSPQGSNLNLEQTIVRRSADYQPPTWNYDFIQSLTTHYVGGSYTKRVDELKESVRMLLKQAINGLHKLELVDNLQRLGIAYHFEDEIIQAMKDIHHSNHGAESRGKDDQDLYATSLEFRLLRQHGYHVPQEVFNSFKDEQGEFKACLCDDMKGMLNLYEASYFLTEGESILEEAKDFAAKNLEKYVAHHKDKGGDECISKLVSHALELPLHWRVKRVEARWFIDFCQENKQITEPIFLELAKLDFNMVQARHQDDLKHASRWWNETDIGDQLEFARNRIVESFFWTVGMMFEPQFGLCRQSAVKVNALIVTIDDIYDIYGTLDELELFTRAVTRWDISEVDQLPQYMQICFLSLYNTINSLADDILIRRGFRIISYLKKAWADLCKAYLLEAKWYYSGYIPTFQEYLDNAWISISAPVILIHAYFGVTSSLTKEEARCFEEHYPNIVRWSAIILRLSDDLGTSSDEMKRGDVPKSIQCYMHETGASEEEARDHIRSLISEAWKQMNEEKVSCKIFKEVAMNLARSAQCMYQYGDGHGLQHNTKTKDYVTSILIQPILP